MNNKRRAHIIRVFFVVEAVLCFGVFGARAQWQPENPDSLIIGNWKGSSICQVRNSPCRSEIVLYHITWGGKPYKYNIVMNKIVEGREEEMGTLYCTFSPSTSRLISDNYNGDWRFTLRKEAMDGELYYKNTLYRIIKVTKLH